MKMPRRMLTLLTAALLGLTACGERPKAGATLAPDLTRSFVGMPLDLEEGAAPLYAADGTLWLEIGEDVLLCDIATGECRPFPLHTAIDFSDWTHSTALGRVLPLPGGDIGLLYTANDGVDPRTWLPMSSRSFLDVYDSEGTFRETRPLRPPEGDYTFQSDRITVDADGWWAFQWSETFGDPGALYVSDPSMDEIRAVDLHGETVSQIVNMPDGRIVARSFSSGGESASFWTVDPKTAAASPLTVKGMPRMPQYLTGGADGYAFFVSTDGAQAAIYGIRETDGAWTAEPVLDFANSDIDQPGTWQSYPLAGGQFLLYRTYHPDGTVYQIMRPRTAEETARLTCLTLAGAGLSNELIRDVCTFNRTHADLRIVLKDYALPGEWPPYTEAVERFRSDLLAGTVPDILCTDGLPVPMLTNKGLLADLRPFMAKDGRFSEDDYLMPWFDTLTEDGRQYQIGFAFTVSTLVGKPSLVGTAQGLDPEAFAAMLEARPAGTDIFDGGWRDLFLWQMRGMQNACIDRAAGTCRFDTPGFIALLEAAAAMPPIDYAAYDMPADAWKNWQDERTLLWSEYLARPYQWHGDAVAVFGDTDVTRVGFPTVSGGNGGLLHADYLLAMYAQSAQQEAVWTFFMEQLGEDVQRRLCREADYSDRLPILRSALEEDMAAAQQGGSMRTTLAEGREVKTGDATADEMAEFYTYLEGVRDIELSDPVIDGIIDEETGMLFAGDQSAEKTAANIQSRVSLYLSEMK